MAYDVSEPAYSFTMSLIDLNADMSNRAHGLFYEATKLAGPDPIDRPKSIIFDSGIPYTIVR